MQSLKSLINIIKTEGIRKIIPILWYYIRWSIAKIFGKIFIKRTILGKKIYLRTTDNGISRALMLLGMREKETYYMLKKIIKKGDIILDLGANIGYYVLIEHTLLKGTGHIYAIEPEPNNVALLKKNIGINNIVNVDIMHAAVSDHNGEIDLHLSDLSNVHSIFDNHEAGNGNVIKVPSMALSSFIKEKKYTINLIRMDIEGAEILLFKDLVSHFISQDKLPHILFEIHNDKYSSQEISNSIQKMLELGYTCKYLAITRGVSLMEQKGYAAEKKVYTDGFVRYIYKDIFDTDLLDCLQLGRAALFIKK